MRFNISLFNHFINQKICKIVYIYFLCAAELEISSLVHEQKLILRKRPIMIVYVIEIYRRKQLKCNKIKNSFHYSEGRHVMEIAQNLKILRKEKGG